MNRTFVILRHTFWDCVAQPIYPLLLLLGAAVIAVFGLLPFFTLGEDTLMFKSVGLDVILLVSCWPLSLPPANPSLRKSKTAPCSR